LGYKDVDSYQALLPMGGVGTDGDWHVIRVDKKSGKTLATLDAEELEKIRQIVREEIAAISAYSYVDDRGLTCDVMRNGSKYCEGVVMGTFSTNVAETAECREGRDNCAGTVITDQACEDCAVPAIYTYVCDGIGKLRVTTIDGKQIVESMHRGPKCEELWAPTNANPANFFEEYDGPSVPEPVGVDKLWNAEDPAK
jgi:hypothetical protein